MQATKDQPLALIVEESGSVAELANLVEGKWDRATLKLIDDNAKSFCNQFSRIIHDYQRLIREYKRIIHDYQRLIREYKRLVHEYQRLVREYKRLIGCLVEYVSDSITQ